MNAAKDFPAALKALRDDTLRRVASRLEADYSPREKVALASSAKESTTQVYLAGDGAVAWSAVRSAQIDLQELILPGTFTSSAQAPCEKFSLIDHLKTVVDDCYSILSSYFSITCEGCEAEESSAHTALNLVQSLPDLRSRTQWNIFASLKDPAVWDAYTLRTEGHRQRLSQLSLIPEIDASIQKRDMNHYRNFLEEQDFREAFGYQIELVRRVYPGWRALLHHSIANCLAAAKPDKENGIQPVPTPFLPRLIVEESAKEFQADLHPETEIGDANFLDHPHRGITTGQTGKIGVGCLIYPCTLGGVTDKVKQRHPLIGNHVLIGTDVGVFGPVGVGDHSVIGPNCEISGFVDFGENVKVRAAAVLRTVPSPNSRPGRLIVEKNSTIGEEALILNDHSSDLVLPEGSVIPAHSHVVNDGEGRPRVI
ncbi:MAG: hypothetical protein KC978_19770 [Candidatus Omnitrophica bacterium]|nr:hypothetical protein [Candidatus Omnitrophota bacterium]